MLVEEILGWEVTNMPFDFLFRETARQYPKINHEELGLPGVYHKTEDPMIFVPDDGVLEMDYLESVLPDDERIFRQSAINSEHETGHITNAKKDKIFEYWLNGIIKLKKLVYPYVITNHDYKQDFIDYCVEGIPMRINLIIYDDKKIEEVLNTLKKKDYTKEEFTGRDHVRFNHCLIFAKKPYAYEVVEELAELFATIENVTLDIRRALFKSLCRMIKYHLKDDDKKRELITMMIKSMPYKTYEGLSYDEIQEAQKEELQNGIAIRDNIINQKDDVIKQDKILLNQKDNVIDEKEKENLRLRKLLRENNISF